MNTDRPCPSVPFGVLVSPSTTTHATLADLIGPQLAAQLDRLDLLSRKVFAGKLQGERRSKRRGRSVEFDDYREYAAGDDLRHVDWNVLARLERFFIKIFQEEEDLAVHVVIDCSASMHAGQPSKVLMAARIATALGYIGLVNNNRVIVTVFGGGRRERLEPLRGRRNVARLARFIVDRVLPPPPMPGAPGGATDPAEEFTSALRGVASEPGGKGVLVVLSDLLIPPGAGTPPGEPAYAPGLRLLAGSALRASSGGGHGAGGAGLDLYVVQILSQGELDPAMEGRAGTSDGSSSGTRDALSPDLFLGDLRLQDAETGRFADVTVTPALVQQYKRTMQAFIAGAAAFCKARGMTHLVTPSDAPIDRFVAGALRRAGALK